MSVVENLPLFGLSVIFLACAAVIGVAGTYLTIIAEKLAKVTGLGQAIIGAVAIGMSTSLAGTILSFYSAWENHPELAIGNALGGLPAQTAFLAIADMTYRRVNIEHGASSLENLAQGALLCTLLSIPLIAMSVSSVTIFAIHPASIVLFLTYIFGVRLTHKIRKQPMWHPRQTIETQKENKDIGPGNDQSAQQLTLKFLGLALILGSTGMVLAETGIELADRTALSETLIGGLFTSVITSLPELVTTLAAVRRGALNLAVGNIIGGNSFDILFLTGADIFYRPGSLYHQIDQGHVLIIGVSILMTGVLMLGLLRREKRGPAGIGFESVLILGLYVLLAGLLFLQ